MKIETMMWLLPVSFMIHDFEEIIFINAWMTRSEKELGKKFPHITARMIPHMKKLSAASFAFCVAEEFFLLCAAVLIMAELDFYSAFAGLLAAYTIHLCAHFIQAAVFRGYIPALVTSIITSFYCIWAFLYLSKTASVFWTEAGLWTLFFIIFIVVNLGFMHFLAKKFERFLNRWAEGF